MEYTPAIRQAVYRHASLLREIFLRYPKLSLSLFDRIIPAYYPAASLAVEFTEKTFENLDTVPSFVLRLAQAGIRNDAKIAEMLGLSLNYVRGVLKMLAANGQIQMGEHDVIKIQETGKESLKTNNSIRQFHASSVFTLDALNLRLIDLEERLHSGNVRNLKYLRKQMIITPAEGIDSRQLEKDLMADGDRFLKDNESLLHVNVVSVEDISFLEMKYADALAMHLRKEDAWLIFCRRNPLNTDRRKKKAVFVPMPFSVPDSSLIERYGLDQFLPTEKMETTEKIWEAVSLYEKTDPLSDLKTDERNRTRTKEIIDSLPLLYSDIDFRKAEIFHSERRIRVRLSEDSFVQYFPALIHILSGCDTNTPYTAACSLWYGKAVSFETEDPKLQTIAALMRKHNSPLLPGLIRSACENKGGTELTDAILSALKEQEVQNV